MLIFAIILAVFVGIIGFGIAVWTLFEMPFFSICFGVFGYICEGTCYLIGAILEGIGGLDL